MTGRVIQGFFVGERPRVANAVAQTAARPRAPGPPAPAFAGRQATVQPRPGLPPLQRMAQASTLQPRAGHGEAFQLPPNLANFGGGAGQPLPGAVRQKMESFFKTDFADVRVHVGAQASSVGALAFTHGSNLYFAPGQYDPATARGQKLLGHELAHVVQQRAGRVRNPFGAGVAVVQDRLLEAEADRLGASAAQHHAPSPPKTGSVHALQAKTRPETIQRTIYKYNKKRKNWSAVELGAKGNFQLPIDGKGGKYFNDVNNKSGKNVKSVRAGLSDLLMISGSLDTLTKKGSFWPTDLWKTLMALPSDLSFLGTITIEKSSKYSVAPYKNAPAGSREILKDLWTKVLKRLMTANGQLGYIERQPWFRNKEAVIKIEVNFYKNRDYGTRLGFHKDTEGDNLFVNILFNNDANIPATEWIEDLADPQPEKQRTMNALMPADMEGAISASRAAMKTGAHQHARQGQIRGGVAPPAAFVSWVDELLWHATPSVHSRTEGRGVDYYDTLFKVYGGKFADVNKQKLYRALKWLSVKQDTEIAVFINDSEDIADGRSKTFILDEYIDYLATGSKERTTLGANIKKYKAHLENAPISLKSAIDTDEPLFGTPTKRLYAATNIKKGTTRRNSLEVISTDDVNMGLRSFLRTWVRVVRNDVTYGPREVDKPTED